MISFASFCVIFAILFTTIPSVKSQSLPPTGEISFSPRFLDSVLQDHAFRAISRHRPRTGVVYDANVPSNLTGSTVSALRLRSGSLRKRGFHGYKEFDIPKGILEDPYVERVILVYQNLGNWSSVYYRLPGYSFLSPVVGLLAYNAVDLTAKGLPELDLRASENPILVKFETLGVSPDGVLPKCVFFDLFGGVVFDRVLNRSICSSETQGHFGIVVEERTQSPVPAPPKVPEYPIAGGESTGGGGGRKKGWWIGGSVAGGVLLAAVLAILVLWVRWCSGRKKIGKMKDAAEGGAPLAVAAVGRAKVPVAMGTRTKPVLENEYVYYEFGIFSTIYEEEEMPNWITDRSTEPSIVFTIPSYPNNLTGLNFCCVLTSPCLDESLGLVDDFILILPVIIVTNTTKKLSWIYKHYIERVNVTRKFLTLLSHWKFGMNEMEAGDNVTILVMDSLDDTVSNAVTKECGVSFVYDDGEEDALNYYNSWKYIIGKDLTPLQLTTGSYYLNIKHVMEPYDNPEEMPNFEGALEINIFPAGGQV